MRDVLMVGAFLCLLIPAFKKPFIAVSLWLWSSMFFPNGWVYGFGQSVHYNLVFTVLAIVGWLKLKNNRPKSKINSLTIIISLFLIWVTLTYLTGIGDSDAAYASWMKFIKVAACYYVASNILVKKEQIDFFIWCIVLSVGFFATIEGLKLVASGGGHHIKGISGHVLDDRNDLALAINMCIPFVTYLRSQIKLKIVQIGLMGIAILMVLCVLGTYSRGGMVGLLVLGVVYFKESNNKIITLIIFAMILYAGSNLMPAEWFNRMDTVQNADKDLSFMGRVVAWKISTLIAFDHPIMGGGIKALESYPIWMEYAPQLAYKLTFVDTPPPDIRPHAAHSMYFQILGDQGFVGLFLFLLMNFIAYIKMNKFIGYFDKNTPFYVLAKMLKLSIIMYLVNGIALSQGYFDLTYSAIYVLVTVLENKLNENTTKSV